MEERGAAASDVEVTGEREKNVRGRANLPLDRSQKSGKERVQKCYQRQQCHKQYQTRGVHHMSLLITIMIIQQRVLAMVDHHWWWPNLVYCLNS